MTLMEEIRRMKRMAKNSICPFCAKPVDPAEIANYDKLTQKEFQMSGLCVNCQNDFFDPDLKAEKIS